jgi:hypothetical protein
MLRGSQLRSRSDKYCGLLASHILEFIGTVPVKFYITFERAPTPPLLQGINTLISISSPFLYQMWLRKLPEAGYGRYVM